MNINKNELAWIAGLVDGDGSISMRNRKNYFTSTLDIVSQDYHTLEHVKNLLSSGSISSPTKRLHRWTTTSKNCIRVLDLLKPYLVTKKEQCSIVMQSSEGTSANGIKKMTEQELDRRESFRVMLNNERMNPVDINFSKGNETYFWDWLGGFFDADGCITMTKSKYKPKEKEYLSYHLILNLSNTHKRTLDFVDSKLNHSTYTPRKNVSSDKLLWTWRIYGDNLTPVLLPLSKTSFSKRKELELAVYYKSLSSADRKQQKHDIYDKMISYKQRLTFKD